MAGGFRRGVVAVMTVTGALALTLLAGCSAAPETTGETDEALPRNIGGGTGTGGGGRIVVDPPPPPPPPYCPAHGENGYTPPKPIAQGTLCLASGAEQQLGFTRGLDSSYAFEAALINAGCSGTVRALGQGPAIPPGGKGWSWTTCADSCLVRRAVRQYHSQNPFVSMTSDVRVNGCSGVPASGEVFVLWDPYCPSGCNPIEAFQ